MLIFSNVVLLAAFLAGSIFAVDIIHHESGGCEGSSTGCLNIAPGMLLAFVKPMAQLKSTLGHCCSTTLFYGSTRFNGLPNPATARRFPHAQCPVGAYDSQAHNPPTPNPCATQFLVTGAQSGKWFHGILNKARSLEDRAVGATTPRHPHGPRSPDDDGTSVCQEPNWMRYFDSNGTAHEIRIPEGRYGEAEENYLARNYDALAAFPSHES